MKTEVAIALVALQCFADKVGWYDGVYDNCGDRSNKLRNLFIGCDMDNLAAKAIDLILKGEDSIYYKDIE